MIDLLCIRNKVIPFVDEDYLTDNLRDLLDSFILQLSRKDCKQLSDHFVYLYLYNLACSKTYFDIPNITLSSPYYPYLIATYNLLFVTKKKDRAKQLFDKVKEAHTKTNGVSFSYNEEKVYELFNEIFKNISIGYPMKTKKALQKTVEGIEINKKIVSLIFSNN